jgi:hypothetical protein
MKSCHDCKNITICKIYENFNQTAMDGLKLGVLSTTTEGNKESWLNIFKSVGQSCHNYIDQPWDSAVRIDVVDKFIGDLINVLINDNNYMDKDNLGKEIFLLTYNEKKQVVEDFLEDRREEIEKFLNSVKDQILSGDLTVDDVMTGFDSFFLAKVGL